MFCSQCGSQNPAQARFCQSCGRALSAAAGATLSGSATVLGQAGATLSEQATRLNSAPPGAPPPAGPLVGKTLGNYELLRELGAGGMARVFLARQRGLERKVALKLFHASLMEDPQQVARFRQEARLLAQLDHPHIIPVIEVVESGPWLGLAMGFAGGGSVRGLVRPEGLPAASIASIGAQAARGLAYAASRGVVHRDIKPDNLLLSEDGRVLLADFGIARAQDSARLTATHALLGTPAYMAPEQWEDSKSCEHRSDLYALGCVLYELAAGRPPFAADKLAQVMRQHLLEVPSPLPGELGLVIGRLLAKRPEDRFADGEAAARALEKVAAVRPQVSSAAPPPRSPPAQNPAPHSPPPVQKQKAAARPPRARQVPPEAAPPTPEGSGRSCGCLLVLALAVGIYFWQQEAGKPTEATPVPEVPGMLSLWPGASAADAAALDAERALLAGDASRLVALPDRLLAHLGEDPSRCAALSPDGRGHALGYGHVGLAEAGFDWEWQGCGARIFDAQGWQQFELPAQGGVTLLDFAPGRAWLAIACSVGNPHDGRNLGSRLEVWELHKGGFEGGADDPTGIGGALAFSPDGGLLAFGSRGGAFTQTDDGVLAISNARLSLYSMPGMRELQARPSLEVRALAFSPDGQRLAVGSRDPVGRSQLGFHFPAVQLLRVPDLEPQALLPLRGVMPRGLAWLPAGVAAPGRPELLVAGCKDGSALLFESTTARSLAYLQAAEAGELLAIRFSADGQRVLAACESGLVEWPLQGLAWDSSADP